MFARTSRKVALKVTTSRRVGCGEQQLNDMLGVVLENILRFVDELPVRNGGP